MSMAVSLLSFPLVFPLLLLGGGAFALLLLEWCPDKWRERAWFWMVLGILGATWWSVARAPLEQGRWLQMDRLAQFSTELLLASGLLGLFAGACRSKEQGFFLLSALFGWILFANAADFLLLFLGLQTVSVALYLWCATLKGGSLHLEAAFKYLALGAIGAACLLYGIALQYWAVGTTEISRVLERALAPDFTQQPLWLTGLLLVWLGLAFKAALFPFQFWAPDLYEGASLPLVGVMVTGMKVAVFVFAWRLFGGGLLQAYPVVANCLVWMGICTLIWAHLGALRQKQIKRFLAYSGMVHAAWLLMALLSPSKDAEEGLLFYLFVYVLANGGLVLFWEQAQRGWKEAPSSVALVSFSLMTLAGLPPTPGFFAKFYMIQLAYASHWTVFWGVALLTAILSTFYYLRYIFTLFPSFRPFYCDILDFLEGEGEKIPVGEPGE